MQGAGARASFLVKEAFELGVEQRCGLSGRTGARHGLGALLCTVQSTAARPGWQADGVTRKVTDRRLARFQKLGGLGAQGREELEHEAGRGSLLGREKGLSQHTGACRLDGRTSL